MTNETMTKVVEILTARGLSATLEHPGVIVVHDGPSGFICWGGANEVIGGDQYDSDEQFEAGDPSGHILTSIPSSCEDAQLIAAVIVNRLTLPTAKQRAAIWALHGMSRCQNCDWRGTEEQLIRPIPNIEQRVAPGEQMPSGECPKCGALCQEVTNARRA